MKGQVASGAFRWKITVSGPLASTLFMFASSEEPPFGSAIFTLRSKEKTTSLDVSGVPSVNLRSGLSVHWYVWLLLSVYSHF